jgi:hypothetical protein
MTAAFGLEPHLRYELNHARRGRVADITAEGRIAQRTHRQREAGIVEEVEELSAEFDCAGFAERRQPEISEHGKIGVEIVVGAQRVASDRTELPCGRRDEGRRVEGEPGRDILVRIADLVGTAIRYSSARIKCADRDSEGLA